MKKVVVTQIKSGIGQKPAKRRTLEALGLRRMQQSVIKELNPAIDGMLRSVAHLVKIEECD